MASIAASTLDAGASNANNARFDSSNAFDTVISRISDGDSFILAFTRADLTPTAPTIADQSAVVGTAFSVTLAVGTGGNPPLSYAVTGRPAWLAFNATSRVLSGTPTAAGTSALTYTVTDDDGDSDSDDFDLVVTAALPDPPVAAFTSVISDLSVAFTDTSTDTPTSWSWDFGDGNSSTAQSPMHTYTIAGTYTVELTATNAGGSDTFSASVTVTAAPPPDTNPTAPTIADQSAVVGTAFSVTLAVGTGGNPPLSYAVTGRPAWLAFNATTRVLSGTPTGAGTSALTYTVTDDDGDSDSDDFDLVVTAADTTPSAPTIADQAGVVGTAFSVTLAVGTGGNPPLSYAVTGRPAWLNFNATSRVLSGTPTAAGTSPLTYTVTDDDGDSDSDDFDIVVTAGLPDVPVANFSRVITDLSVVFTDTSTNTPTSWAWDFDDGNTSTAQNPTHTYASAGSYTVTLTATNAGGSNDRSKTFSVTRT